jgi:hypothetical protein
MRSDKWKYKSKRDSEYLSCPVAFLLHILINPTNSVGVANKIDHVVNKLDYRK